MPINPPRPQEPQGNPFTPPLPEPQAMEQFEGMNTAPSRAGVPDAQCYWLDGFFPYTPRKLRALPGAGSSIYTAGGGLTVVLYGFYNIGSTPYCIVFLSDGSAVQVNTSTLATKTVFPAGTLTNPSITTVGLTQYGQQYLLISSTQTNGYWIWDGTVLYTAGTLAPTVTLTNVGSGYTTPPVVTATGGSGFGATFIVAISNGQVNNVVITNPGSGYLAGDTPSLVFTGGTTSGSGASITASLSHSAGGSGGSLAPAWVVVSDFLFQPYFPTISAGGSGYSNLAQAAFASGGNWSGGRVPGISLTVAAGVITAANLVVANTIDDGAAIQGKINVVSPSGVNTIIINGAPASIGNLVFDNPNTLSISYGTTITAISGHTLTLSNTLNGSVGVGDTVWFVANASVFPTVSITDAGYYFVSSTSIVNHGSGYSPSAKASAVNGGSPQAQAILSLILGSGTISSVVIESGGIYGANTAPTITVTDTATTAAGSVTLMPFGISGSAIATYSGHVWLVDAAVGYFSAPGSPSNFATSAGGGNFTSNSNVLRVGYTQLVNTNGFLYLIGDSSMDYISGVTTSGNPITTSYTLQNADPEVGTPYPASVLTLGPDIVLANSFGVHVSRGAALEKVSEPLDGVYNSVGNFGGLQLASAKATIFNRRCYMLLEQIVNPVSGATVNQLMMWDGGKKWWSSAQDFSSLTFIATQEINSILTAYGTDGTNIKPLFQTPTTGFQKVVQSRFWDAPGGYQFTKATGRFWSVWNYHTNSSPNLIIDIDAITINGSNGSTTLTTQGYTITGPATSGYFVTPPQAVGQQGILTGMTLKTSEGDVELVSAMIQNDPKISYRG